MFRKRSTKEILEVAQWHIIICIVKAKTGAERPRPANCLLTFSFVYRTVESLLCMTGNLEQDGFCCYEREGWKTMTRLCSGLTHVWHFMATDVTVKTSESFRLDKDDKSSCRTVEHAVKSTWTNWDEYWLKLEWTLIYMGGDTFTIHLLNNKTLLCTVCNTTWHVFAINLEFQPRLRPAAFVLSGDNLNAVEQLQLRGWRLSAMCVHVHTFTCTETKLM